MLKFTGHRKYRIKYDSVIDLAICFVCLKLLLFPKYSGLRKCLHCFATYTADFHVWIELRFDLQKFLLYNTFMFYLDKTLKFGVGLQEIVAEESSSIQRFASQGV